MKGRIIAIGLATIALLCVCTIIQVEAQPVLPVFPIDLPDLELADVPPSPTLVSPANDHVLHDALVIFTWQPRTGSTPAQYFRFCIAEVNRSCSQAGAVTSTNIPTTTTSYTPPGGLPLRFQGKALFWTVFACASSRVSFGGMPVDLCNRATPRRLYWQLPGPELTRPSGLVTNLRPNFAWHLVVGADSYLVCVSKPGIACPLQPVNNANTVVVAVPSNAYTPPSNQVLTQFAGQTVHWTAAACNATFGCVYQTQVAEITFPVIPPLTSAPILNSPPPGHVTLSRRQQFSWQPVPGAASYKLCVSPPGVQCGTASSYETVPLGVTIHETELPQWLGPIGTTLNWTAAACNTFNQCAYQQQVRPLIIGPLPALSFNPSSQTMVIGASQNATIQSPAAGTSPVTVTLTPQNASVAINDLSPGVPAVVVISANASTQMFTIHAVGAGSATITAAANGYRSATMQVTIPTPTARMTIAPIAAAVTWGQTATYGIELASENGFGGMVMLTVDQLPPGVTQLLSTSAVALTSNGPPQQSTLSLSTPLAATTLGTTTFRVRATAGTQTNTQRPTLTINRLDGDFVQRPRLSASQTCGTTVRANYASVGVNDIRVTFQITQSSGTVSTQAIPAVYYAMSQSPQCRIGIVMHPCQNVSCSGAGEPAVSWYNLGWSTMTGAPQIGRQIENITQINWHQFWLSPDQSLLLLITKMNQAVTCPPNCTHLDIRAFVFDTITGDQLGRTDFRTRATGNPADPVADVTGATLSGNTVTIRFTRETGNADSRDITIR
jgi:hypothetical protein